MHWSVITLFSALQLFVVKNPLLAHICHNKYPTNFVQISDSTVDWVYFCLPKVLLQNKRINSNTGFAL